MFGVGETAEQAIATQVRAGDQAAGNRKRDIAGRGDSVYEAPRPAWRLLQTQLIFTIAISSAGLRLIENIPATCAVRKVILQEQRAGRDRDLVWVRDSERGTRKR